MREDRVDLIPQGSKLRFIGKEPQENKSSSTGHTGTSAVEQEQSPVNDSSLCSTSPICSAPLCRQFWKAGNYHDGLSTKSSLQNKTLNPRDGSSALLIQDDGGGMDPEAMRRCLSFGFSDKKSKSAIGQYGNGFKTSSMRLGADVIVFSRHNENRKLTQSIGLLSYTFLMQTGHDRIVIPMVDYELNTQSGIWNKLKNTPQYMDNLSLLLQWSPYATEADLLKQFDDIGNHGTKIIIYNLWCTNDGTMELDFESDPQDIRISGEADKNEKGGSRMAKSEQHLANRLRFSLRAYLSILYLRVPENFCIVLRGQVVEHHNIADDLKFPEYILYKPQSGGCIEGIVVTTIGFLKEAPLVNIHGFNVYHKNRLILPFWHVVSYADSRGRGVVGILEANFISPTHNKQDFEKTPVFQKLESRLKDMTWEYWDYHCGLIGYQAKKKTRIMTSQATSDSGNHHGTYQPVLLSRDHSATNSNLQKGASFKRKENNLWVEPERVRRKVGIGANSISCNQDLVPSAVTANELEKGEADNLIQENKKLHAKCLEYEKRGEKLNLEVARLRVELREAQHEYSRLLAESKLLEKVKVENPTRIS